MPSVWGRSLELGGAGGVRFGPVSVTEEGWGQALRCLRVGWAGGVSMGAIWIFGNMS